MRFGCGNGRKIGRRNPALLARGMCGLCDPKQMAEAVSWAGLGAPGRRKWVMMNDWYFPTLEKLYKG